MTRAPEDSLHALPPRQVWGLRLRRSREVLSRLVVGDRFCPFLLLFLLFLLVNLAVYGNVLRSYFLSDDYRLIGRAVDHGLLWGFRRFLRPVLVLSFVADLKLWQLEPLGYHLTNLFLHTANGLLLVVLSVSLLGTVPMPRRHVFLISALAGLLFLALPSHTESVSWISGRSDLLATGFMLASLIAYCVFCQSRRSRILLLALVSFTLALLTKESAVSLPFVILLCTIPFAVPCDSNTRLLSLATAPLLFFAVLAPYAVLRYAWVGELVGGYGPKAHLTFDTSLILYKTICMALRTFLPPMSDRFAELVQANAYLSPMRGAALALLLSFLVISLSRLLTAFRTAISPTPRRLALLIMLLAAAYWVTAPMLGTVGVSLTDTQGERFLYTPSVFASIAVVYALSLAGRVWLLAVPGALGIAILCAVQTHRVNENWRIAGELSRALVHDLAAHAQRTQMLLINVPDNYNGAYVLRNGLDEAVRIFGRAGHVRAVKGLSFHGVRSIQAGAIVSVDPGSPGSYRLRLSGDRAEILHVTDNELAVTYDRSTDGFAFTLIESREGVDSKFYSAGRFHDLPARSSSAGAR